MTFTYCKKVIDTTTYNSQTQKEEMKVKLDVFLLNDRITQEQYTDLVVLLAAKEITAEC
jgi:ATP-dependent Clp protease adapter protein ClpS